MSATPEAPWLTCIDLDEARGRFAVGRSDGAVVLADLVRGEPLVTEPLHADRVAGVAFAGELLWSAGFDGTVVGWDLARRAVRHCFEAGHGRVLALRAEADGLATAGDDGAVRLWEPDGRAVRQVLDEHRFGPAYAVAEGEGWLAIGYQNGYVGVWEPEGGGWGYAGCFQPAGRGPLYAMAVSPRTPAVVAFARDGAVGLYAPGEWQPVAQLPVPLACNDLRFNATGTRLLGACSDRAVRVWDWSPMVDAPFGHWSRIARDLGDPMRRGDAWVQAMIFSGARFMNAGGVIASSFDGGVHLFPPSPIDAYLPHVAQVSAPHPTGWG